MRLNTVIKAAPTILFFPNTHAPDRTPNARPETVARKGGRLDRPRPPDFPIEKEENAPWPRNRYPCRQSAPNKNVGNNPDARKHPNGF